MSAVIDLSDLGVGMHQMQISSVDAVIVAAAIQHLLCFRFQADVSVSNLTHKGLHTVISTKLCGNVKIHLKL